MRAFSLPFQLLEQPYIPSSYADRIKPSAWRTCQEGKHIIHKRLINKTVGKTREQENDLIERQTKRPRPRKTQENKSKQTVTAPHARSAMRRENSWETKQAKWTQQPKQDRTQTMETRTQDQGGGHKSHTR